MKDKMYYLLTVGNLGAALLNFAVFLWKGDLINLGACEMSVFFAFQHVEWNN